VSSSPPSPRRHKRLGVKGFSFLFPFSKWGKSPMGMAGPSFFFSLPSPPSPIGFMLEDWKRYYRNGPSPFPFFPPLSGCGVLLRLPFFFSSAAPPAETLPKDKLFFFPRRVNEEGPCGFLLSEQALKEKRKTNPPFLSRRKAKPHTRQAHVGPPFFSPPPFNRHADGD